MKLKPRFDWRRDTTDHDKDLGFAKLDLTRAGRTGFGAGVLACRMIRMAERRTTR